MQQVDNKEVLSANNSTHEFNYIFSMIYFDTQGIERVQEVFLSNSMELKHSDKFMNTVV